MFLSSAYSSWWSFNLGFVQKAVHWISCPAWTVFVNCLWSPDITAVWGRLGLNLWPDVDASSRNRRCIFQVVACVPGRPGSTSFPIWLSWGALKMGGCLLLCCVWGTSVSARPGLDTRKHVLGLGLCESSLGFLLQQNVPPWKVKKKPSKNQKTKNRPPKERKYNVSLKKLEI